MYKISLLLSLFLCFGTSVFGQLNAPVSNSDKIYDKPDVIPMYTGGSSEMHRFISNTLKYPANAVERNVQGLVVYTFVVEKDGTLSNFNIIHRSDSLLNEEALRILKLMPAWRPARFNGEIVRSESYVPMYFRLRKNLPRTATGETAQTAQPAQVPVTAKTDSAVLNNNEVLSIVDKMPQYATGEVGLSNFISQTLRYPAQARQEGIQGRILCTFVVASDGSVSNIEVVEGADQALNDEAVRVLSLMPNWIPGENNGEKVNVRCLLPIDFVLEGVAATPLTTVQ